MNHRPVKLSTEKVFQLLIALAAIYIFGLIFVTYPHFDILGAVANANDNIAGGDNPLFWGWTHRPIIYNLVIYIVSYITHLFRSNPHAFGHMLVWAFVAVSITVGFGFYARIFRSIRQENLFVFTVLFIGNILIVPHHMFFQGEFIAGLFCLGMISAFGLENRYLRFFFVAALAFLISAMKYATASGLVQALILAYLFSIPFKKSDILAIATGLLGVCLLLLFHPTEFQDLLISVYAQHVSTLAEDLMHFAQSAFKAVPNFLNAAPFAILPLAATGHFLFENNPLDKKLAVIGVWLFAVAPYFAQSIGSLHHMSLVFCASLSLSVFFLKEGLIDNKIILGFIAVLGAIHVGFITASYNPSGSDLAFVFGTYGFLLCCYAANARIQMIVLGLLLCTATRFADRKLKHSEYYYNLSKKVEKVLEGIPTSSPTLFLGDAETNWLASGRKSACRMSLPVPIQRTVYRDRAEKLKDLEQTKILEKCIRDFDGTLVIRSKYFDKVYLEPELMKKLENYDLIFKTNERNIEIYKRKG